MSPTRSLQPLLFALPLIAALAPTNAVAQEAEGIWRLTDGAAPCADLRRSPRLSATSKRCVPPGTRVRALRAFEDWRRVRLDDGTKGWLPAAWLAVEVVAPSAKPTTAPDDPPVRKARVLVPLAYEEEQRETPAEAAPAVSPEGALRAELVEALARNRDLDEELRASRQRQRELRERLVRAEASQADLRRRLSAAHALARPEDLPPADDDATGAETVPPGPANGAAAGQSTDPGSLPSTGPDLAALVAALEAWATAWSEQRVDDYLAFYAPGFQPPAGASRAAWEASRRRRLSAPDYIRVTLSSFGVRPLGSDRASVRFTQRYESDSYEDVVRKRLELVKIGGRWKIAEEISEGQ